MKKSTNAKILAIFIATTFMVQGCSPQRQTGDSEATAKLQESQKEKNPAVPGTATDNMDSPKAVAIEESREELFAAGLNEAESTSRRTLKKIAIASDKAAANFMAAQVHPLPVLYSQESYNPVKEQSFVSAANDPLSTFSIDVDTGSYSNIRRLIQANQTIPPGAVRIEEMINYFNYNYSQPQKGPVAIHTELGPCPWNSDHQLAMIGLKAKEIAVDTLPPSNLVFLVDVSGSMNQSQKLPLVKKAIKMLAGQLSSKDRLSIVVYAGSNRIVLPPTAGDKTQVIIKAIDQLHSGGSTHGSAAIQRAYQLAHQNFFPGGNNRIILASDGDFNVGVTSRDELTRLIEKEREKGVFLTVLGFGSGNYKDDTMEMLADKGNGNYSYIDSLLEAKKVLVKERFSNLYTLAKDVKLQVEFNPAKVGAYRLIGYDNRLLADEDFNDDSKDAGEIGVGHTVTALYEIIPPGSPDLPDVPKLKYQEQAKPKHHSEELLTVSLRYKEPAESTSQLLSSTLKSSAADIKSSLDFQFASSVAWFGMYLQQSKHLSEVDMESIIKYARKNRGSDEEGLRAEFIRLMENVELLEKS